MTEADPEAKETSGKTGWLLDMTGDTEIAPGLFYEPDRGTFRVVGRLVADPSLRSGEPLDVPEGEKLVEIPADVLDIASRTLREMGIDPTQMPAPSPEDALNPAVNQAPDPNNT